MKKQTIITACTFAAMTMATPAVFAVQPAMSNHVCASDAIKKDNRPVESKRLFRSKAVEEQIQRIQQLLKNQKLSWMFTNCFPNTLDTTVHFRKDKKDGKPDTFRLHRRYPCHVAPRLRCAGVALRTAGQSKQGTEDDACRSHQPPIQAD